MSSVQGKKGQKLYKVTPSNGTTRRFSFRRLPSGACSTECRSGAQECHSGAQECRSGAQECRSGAQECLSGAHNVAVGRRNVPVGRRNVPVGRRCRSGAQTEM